MAIKAAGPPWPLMAITSAVTPPPLSSSYKNRPRAPVLSLRSLSRSHTLLLTPTRAAAPEICRCLKLGRRLDLLYRFISAARPFLYGLSCGEQALPRLLLFDPKL
jgi:hypothetical protein